jgi:hypothetical protein
MNILLGLLEYFVILILLAMILWRIDPLLGRDFEANNETATVAVQWRRKHASTTIELLLGKHVPAATVTHATGETGCCLRGPCRRV